MPVCAFKVEASLLINEGGVQCVSVVFAYPLEGGGDIELGAKPSLQRRAARGARSGAGCEARAGAGAFVLEDPMDSRRFQCGDVVHLS